MNRQIIKELAEEEKVTQELLNKIGSSLFRTFKNAIDEREFRSVRYSGFGSFFVFEENIKKYYGSDYIKEAVVDIERLDKPSTDDSGADEEPAEDAAGTSFNMQTL